VTDELLERLAVDDAAWDVYADALEEQGDLAGADLVRAVPTIAALVDARAILSRALGRPRAWLARLAHGPQLEGTCWSGRTDSGAYVLAFEPGGVLRYREGSTRSDDDDDGASADETSRGGGHWTQIGRAVTFAIVNAQGSDYSRHEGIVGDATEPLSGIGSDPSGTTWRWSFAPITRAQYEATPFEALGAVDEVVEGGPLLDERRYR